MREEEKSKWETLIGEVRQIAYQLHVYLGNGLLEKVYENGLKHRLEAAGYTVEAQKPLQVKDVDGFVLGDYFADLMVNGKLVVELKAVRAITNEHYAQILNYLKITGMPCGLLINFGSYQFEARTVFLRDNSRIEMEKGRAGEAPRPPRAPQASTFLPFSTAKSEGREVGRVEMEKGRELFGHVEMEKGRAGEDPSPPRAPQASTFLPFYMAKNSTRRGN